MHAVEGVSLSLDAGDVLGIVGESGSGKSVTMMALMGLVAYPGVVTADKLRFDGHDLLTLSDSERSQAHRQRRGDDLPGPHHQPQPLLYRGLSTGRDAQAAPGAGRQGGPTRSIELLEQVGIPAPESRLKVYPAPDVGRHEPARDDRHGHCLQPQAADCRRTHHRAGRDDSGADSGPAAQPAKRTRHGAGADHAQHGRGVRDGAARGGDVRRPDHGRASAHDTVCQRRSIPTPRR